MARTWAYLGDHSTAVGLAVVASGAAAMAAGWGARAVVRRVGRAQADMMAEMRRERFYEAAQGGVAHTLVQLLPGLQSAVDERLEVPSASVIRAAGSRDEKVRLWNEAKRRSLAKVVCSVYAVVLEVVLLRVQVNLLARYLYLDSCRSNAVGDEPAVVGGSWWSSVPDDCAVTPTTRAAYMRYAEHLLSRGMDAVARLVEAAVAEVVDSYALERRVEYRDFVHMMQTLRASVESAEGLPKLVQCMLPPEEEQAALNDRPLSLLLNETRDVLESAPLETAIRTCLDVAFAQMLEELRHAILRSGAGESQPLAKLIPIVCGVYSELLTPLDRPLASPLAARSINHFVDIVAGSRELERFAYTLFNSFD